MIFLLFASSAYASCGPGGRLKQGDKTYVCLVVASSLNWEDGPLNYVRYPFEVELDEYSRVQVRDAWSSLPSLLNSTTLSLSVQSEERVSFQKMWRGDGKSYPFLSVVIKVENGKVTQVAWDDGCYDCSDCEENTFEYDGSRYRFSDKQCAYRDSKCEKGGVTKLCELSVFVSWSGTDKRGMPLLSQRLRFSRFDPDDVAEYVQDLQDDSYPTPVSPLRTTEMPTFMSTPMPTPLPS